MANKVVTLGTLAAPGATDWVALDQGPLNVQASLMPGATAATVYVEWSVDRVGAIAAATITLDSTTRSDGVAFDEELSWPYGRIRAGAVTGGSVIAAVTVKGA